MAAYMEHVWIGRLATRLNFMLIQLRVTLEGSALSHLSSPFMQMADLIAIINIGTYFLLLSKVTSDTYQLVQRC